MKKIISGRIFYINEEERIIGLKVKDRQSYFYLQRSLLNKIGKYLELSRFIQFVIDDKPRIYKKTKVYTVEYIIKVMAIRYRKNIVYYDIKKIKNGTKDLINNLDVKMFLDLEMSMHPYKVDKNFTQEIIQVGYYLVDKENNIIEEYNELIKPKLHPKLTRRTLKFLEITQAELNKGIEYIDFYTHFKNVIEKYNPSIIVWGRNDFLALRESYKINGVKTLRQKTRYINLLKLHKNFFNLRNDLGLFNAYKTYTNIEDPQAHNALEDAKVTFQIYEGFKKVVNNEIIIDLSNFK
jgi:sporulation inhibitor KapD